MAIILWIFMALSFIAILQWLGIILQLRRFIVQRKGTEPKSETEFEAIHEATYENHSLLADTLTIIIPIKGADESSKKALQQLLRLPLNDHIEILFVMEEETDPASTLVKSIINEHPTHSQRCRIIMSGKCEQGMGKIHNMRAGISHASHEQLLFMDADVEMTMDVIVHGLKALADKKTGAASALPLYRNPIGMGETIITIWTNDYFLPCLLGLRQMKPFPFLIGACMFTRRDVLSALNDLAGAEKYISDDAYFAEQISLAGFNTSILPHAVTMTDSKSASEGWQHLLRWFIMLRHFNPFVYLSVHNWHSIHVSLLALIIALFTQESLYITTSIILITAAITTKLLGASWFNNQLKAKEPFSRYWRMIVYECFIFPTAWITGLFRNTLIWRGRKYTLGSKGVIHKVEEN